MFLFAAAAVCFATVRCGLGYVANHGIHGVGMAVSFTYEESRALLRWGDVAGVGTVGAALLCLRAAAMLPWREDVREYWLLAGMVMLMFLTVVFGWYG